MSAPVARRYFARGKEQLRAGELDAAAQSFAAAVELAPYFTEARVGAALTLARTDPPRAAQLLRRGLQGVDPRAARAACSWSRSATCSPPPATSPAPTRPTPRRARCPARHPLATRLARLQAKTGRYAEALATLARGYVARGMPEQDDGGVVDAAVRQRRADQRVARLVERAARSASASISFNIQSSTMSVEAVAAEQVHVARLHRDGAMVDLDLLAQPDGAHDDVRVGRAEARRQLGVVLVEVDERVVARDLLELALPQAVDARVADVTEVQEVAVLADGDDGGAHVVQRRVGLAPWRRRRWFAARMAVTSLSGSSAAGSFGDRMTSEIVATASCDATCPRRDRPSRRTPRTARRSGR